MSPRTESPQSVGSSLAWGVAAVIAVAVSLFAFHVRECFVDDAFTGFRYIHNLLAGHGFVFYPGERPVEGVTNIGWLLALTPLSAAVGPTLAAKATGLALLLASLATTMLLCRALAMRLERTRRPETPGQNNDRPFGLTLIPTILLACSFEFIYFPLAGMETALLALLLLLMAYASLRQPSGIVPPLLGAFAFLVHPEAVVVYPLYAGILRIGSSVGDESRRRSPSISSDDRRLESPPTMGRESRRQLVVGALIFLAAIVAITAIRFAYFGDVVPNTFHSKPGGVQLAVGNAYAFLMGQNTNIAFPITGWLVLPVLLLGWRRLGRASSAGADMLAAITVVGLIFAIYSPQDWSALPRYFAPYLPAALILLWSGLEEAAAWAIVARGSGSIAKARRPILAAIAVVLALTDIVDTRSEMLRMDVYPGYVLAGKTLMGPAGWIRDHLTADATIATRRIGIVAYYSGRKVFDYMYGLPEPEVARLVARRGERFDTPTDPALETLWRIRAPEYLLEDAAIMDDIIAKAAGARERFAIHGIEYHVVREFPIGHGATWVLAERLHEGTGASGKGTEEVVGESRTE